MDDEYDCIVLGTGLTECILSGVLSVAGLKVLHMDRNGYYGGESASLTLEQLYEQYGSGKPGESLGASRNWNIDLIPKFIMATGFLVKILLHAGVTKYLEFKCVDGAYVLKGNKIEKVPATDKEALSSDLMGFFEKRSCKNFLQFVQGYDEEKPKSFSQFKNMKTLTMRNVFAYYKLEENTIDFIGHSIALQRDDSYLDEPAIPTLKRIKLYMDSLMLYGKSPYIYPLYGLAELPQAFARLAAIYGGTYMLNKPIDGVEFDQDGKFVGVKSEGQIARAKFVAGDPTYFPDKVEKTGEVVRCICLLNHPVPNTNKSESCQIILPQKQVGRKSDIYIGVVSFSHHVASAGHYIAICSTTVETGNPHSELDAALKLLGPIQEKFYIVKDTFEPLGSGENDNVFISKSYDATSHFETSSLDILDLYKRIRGEELDLTAAKSKEEE